MKQITHMKTRQKQKGSIDMSWAIRSWFESTKSIMDVHSSLMTSTLLNGFMLISK